MKDSIVGIDERKREEGKRERGEEGKRGRGGGDWEDIKNSRRYKNNRYR